MHNKRGEGEIFHALSWKKKENPLIKQKNALILEESALFDVSLGYFIIENAVLRVSWRKNTQIFPCGALLLSVVHETFIELPLFQETSPGTKNFCLRAIAPCFLTWLRNQQITMTK